MRFAGLFFTLLILAFAPPLAAAELPPLEVAFSATRSLAGKGKLAVGPYAHADGKERWEATLNGKVRVLIRRPDLDRSFAYEPARGVGKQSALGDSLIMPPMNATDRARLKEVGREQMEGEEVTRYEILDSKGTVTFWITDDGIPLRILGAGDGRQFDIKVTGVVREPQAPELFEVPAGIAMY